MKTMLLAAAAVLSLGFASAYANESGRQAGGYLYPDYQFPTPQNAPVGTAAQKGQASHSYVAQSKRGTWLFPANENQGANS